MTQRSLRHRISVVLFTASMTLASVLPAFLGGSVTAAQLTERSLTIGSSKASATSVNYAFTFKPATISGTGSDDIKGIVVQFCTSPLVGVACTAPTGLAGAPADAATVTVTSGSGVSFTVDNASNQADLTILTDSTGIAAPAAGTPITFSFTAMTNPSVAGTFFARILTYNSTAGAAAYTATAPGTHLDDGGVAAAIVSQLTVNARVQEQLQFCVGSLDNGGSAPADCATGFTGTTVDIGVVDSAGAVTPVATSSGGNNKNGAAMVRTNAANGVVIDYFAEQATSGTNHLGSLRVTGASCNAGAVGTDQCFNSAGTTSITFTASTEKFGMTISSIDVTSSATPTSNVVRDAAYDGNGSLSGTCTAADAGTDEPCWAWDESGSFDRIASSAGGGSAETRVVDDEMLLLRFAAVAGVTTPTGQYTVVSTYVATATF
jgi:hypothetical protein